MLLFLLPCDGDGDDDDALGRMDPKTRTLLQQLTHGLTTTATTTIGSQDGYIGSKEEEEDSYSDIHR
jgi:hypothetical protein